MGKNRIGLWLFISIGMLFCFFSSAKVNAQDYNIEVESVENLIYGNRLEEAQIIAHSDIEGSFVFSDPSIVLDNVGNIELSIQFRAKNIEYTENITFLSVVSPRKISVVFERPIYKQYNGDTSIQLPTHEYAGIINDEVSVEGVLNGELLGSYVGEGIGVVLSGIEVIGEKKDCYYIDLTEHSARIYPSVLEKDGENHTKIFLENDMYVDIGYSLKVVETEIKAPVGDKYTSFVKYEYLVYNHNNSILEFTDKYKISMKVNDEILKNERLGVFELDKNGEYSELEYQIADGVISFEINRESSIVFATRNIEYNLILIFSAFLLVIFTFIGVYRIINVKRKNNCNL